MEKIWTVGEVLRVAEELALTSPGQPSRSEIAWCLADLLDLDRLTLLMQHERPLQEAERGEFRSRLASLLEGVPLAYVLGHQDFYEHRFEVGPGVLIPRSETELLVGRALADLPEGARVFEPCTGSGCIGISLVLARDDLRVLSTDLSEEALVFARRNAEILSADPKRLALRRGSYWEPAMPAAPFDALLANPPYVDSARPELLDESVRRHEPKAALFADGADALSAYRALFEGAGDGLRPGGLLLMELGSDTANSVASLALASGWFEKIQVLPDLGGRDRLLHGYRVGA